jgi:hypothetical protein
MKEKRAARNEAIIDDEPRPDWLSLLDEEVGRLPHKYRLPVELCDLQGRTRKEAARQLGWPEGTLSGRLSRARDLLARRLTRRGVTVAVGTLALGLAHEVSARVPFSLVSSTCKAAMGFAAESTMGAVSAPVASLTEGVVKAMLFSKLKNVAALATVALVLTAGFGAWCYAPAAGQTEEHLQEAPVRSVPDVGAAQAPTPKIVPRAPRTFQIDLRIVQKKKGERKLLAAPQFLTLEGTPASFASGDCRTIQLGGGKTEEVVMGPAVRVVVRSNAGRKIRLDTSVSQPGHVILDDAVILETKTSRCITDTALGEATQIQFVTDDKAPTVLEVTATVREAKVRIEVDEK